MIIDIQAELAELPDASEAPDGEQSEMAVTPLLTDMLGKLAKQQFRSTQLAQHALDQLQAELQQSRALADERRREIERLRTDAEDVRTRLIETLDALDDLLVMARQRDDDFWIGRLQRLESRFVALLQSIGVTELPGVGSPFDEYLHEVLEVAEAHGSVPLHTVLEQVKKGYRYEGRVLRRAQVITTK